MAIEPDLTEEEAYHLAAEAAGMVNYMEDEPEEDHEPSEAELAAMEEFYRLDYGAAERNEALWQYQNTLTSIAVGAPDHKMRPETARFFNMHKAISERIEAGDGLPPVDDIQSALLALVWRNSLFNQFVYAVDHSTDRGEWMMCEQGFWQSCASTIVVTTIEGLAKRQLAMLRTSIAQQVEAIETMKAGGQDPSGTEAMVVALGAQAKYYEKLSSIRMAKVIAVIQDCPLLVIEAGDFIEEQDRIRIGSSMFSTETLEPINEPPTPMEFRTSRPGGIIAPDADEHVLWEHAPTFRSFMELHFNDETTPEWEAFLRILASVTLYSAVGSKTWLHLMGVGNAGKDTVLEQFLPAIVGQSRIAILAADAVKASHNAPSPERLLAPLEGARVAVIKEELGDGQRINTTALKSIVNGAGTMRASAKYQRERDFQWNGSLVTHGNTPPKIGAELPIENRLVLIPFAKQFPVGANPVGIVTQYQAEAKFFARLVVRAGQRWRAAGGTRDALLIPTEWMVQKAEMLTSADDTTPLVKCWRSGSIDIPQRFITAVSMELAKQRGIPQRSSSFWMPAIKRNDPQIEARRSNSEIMVKVQFYPFSMEGAVELEEIASVAHTVGKQAARDGKKPMANAAMVFLASYGYEEYARAIDGILAFNT